MKLNNHFKKNSGLIALGVLLIALDQIIKYLFITNYPNLIVRNSGAVFGFIDSVAIGYALLLLGFAALIWIIVKNKNSNFWVLLFLVLIGAGAVSNLVDRFINGAVIDYIHFFNLNVFNLADIYIIIGILGYVIMYNPPKAK